MLEADPGAGLPIAAFEAEQLEGLLQPLGGPTPSDRKDRLVLAGGRSAIVFISVAFNRGAHIPGRLIHRVIAADAELEGALIATHHTELHVLGPPVEGAERAQPCRAFVGSWHGGTEATPHEAEATPQSRAQESQDRLASS